ncbi:MAG TPA: PadR family transcriptional regulator [Vicinamibacterales bacterium]|nr:PadR family transcriptional regulator [Vicinamibacterales bacterium]
MSRGTPTDRLMRGTVEMLLLKSLSRGPLHGYAIARRIEADTADALSVEEGSLYPALHRLEDRGDVSAKWSATSGGRRVRVYALTPAGRVRLASEKQGWQSFARAVSRMLETK